MTYYEEREKLSDRIIKYLKVKRAWIDRAAIIKLALSLGYTTNQLFNAFDWVDAQVEVAKIKNEKWRTLYRYMEPPYTSQQLADEFQVTYGPRNDNKESDKDGHSENGTDLLREVAQTGGQTNKADEGVPHH